MIPGTLCHLLIFPKLRPLVRVRRVVPEEAKYVCEWAQDGPKYKVGDLIVRNIPRYQLEAVVP